MSVLTNIEKLRCSTDVTFVSRSCAMAQEQGSDVKMSFDTYLVAKTAGRGPRIVKQGRPTAVRLICLSFVEGGV